MTTKQLENPQSAIKLHGGLKDRVQVQHILKHYQSQRRKCNSIEGCKQLDGKIQRFQALLEGW